METWKFWVLNVFTLVVVSIALVGLWLWVDQIIGDVQRHYGTTIEFNTFSDYYLQIDAESVVITAAADGDFVLRNEEGNFLNGDEMPKPLGWESSKYVYLEPVTIPGGKWKVSESDGVTIHLESDSPFSVKEVQADTVNESFRWFWAIVFLLIWICTLWGCIITPAWKRL